MSNNQVIGMCLFVFFVLTCANTVLDIVNTIDKKREISVFKDEQTGCEYLINGQAIVPRRNEFGGVICKQTVIEVP